MHDHRWRVRVVVRAAELDRYRAGCSTSTRSTRRSRAFLAPYAGTFLNDVPPFDDVNPTRENVARVIAEGLAAKLDDGRARVHRVDVSEDGHCASYVRARTERVARGARSSLALELRYRARALGRRSVTSPSGATGSNTRRGGRSCRRG